MVRYQIQINEQHFAEGLLRRRKIGCSKYGRVALKAAAFLGLIALGLVGLLVHAWPITLLATFLVALLWVGPRLDFWLYVRKLRKAPFYGQLAHIEATETSYSYQTDQMSGRASWALITSAHRLPDGFLLFDGTGSCQWWPDSGLIEGTPEQMRASEMPYRAMLADGKWTVTGSLPEDGVGGTAIAVISKSVGHVLRLTTAGEAW